MPTIILGKHSSAVGSNTDAFIASNNPTTNAGSSALMYVNATAGYKSRSVLKFTGLPSGPVKDVTATLSILTSSAVPASNTDIVVRELLSEFVEGQVTWNIRATGNNWDVAGALTGADADPAVLATQTITSTGSTRYNITGAGLSNLVKDWINGTKVNNGVILSLADEAVYRDMAFRTGQDGTATRRPYLTISWTVDEVIKPVVSVSNKAITNLAGTTFVRISIDKPDALDVTGLVSTADVTATAGVDYTALVAVPWTISAGQTFVDVPVNILP